MIFSCADEISQLNRAGFEKNQNDKTFVFYFNKITELIRIYYYYKSLKYPNYIKMLNCKDINVLKSWMKSTNNQVTSDLIELYIKIISLHIERQVQFIQNQNPQRLKNIEQKLLSLIKQVWEYNSRDLTEFYKFICESLEKHIIESYSEFIKIEI